MSRLKTLGMYASWVILFYIFSNVLIFIGLNANYDNINTTENLPSQVQIDHADATAVNGRISGKITDDGSENINGKYMKVDLYSSKNVLMGTKYLNIDDIQRDSQGEFDINFKAQNVAKYAISFVDKLEDTHNDLYKVEFLNRPLTAYEKFLLLLTLIFIV